MSNQPRDEVQVWLRGTGIEIVLVILGAVLPARFVHMVADRGASTPAG